MRTSVLAVTFAVCLLVSAALVQGGAVPKATGGVEFTRMEDGMEVSARVEFTAHAASNGRPAKGMLKYHDSRGTKFTVDVDCVDVYGNYAAFSGPIVKTNDDDMEGMWLVVWVMDGGSPADGNDEIGGEMFDYDPGCEVDTAPPEWWPVYNGNLTVHE